MAVTVPTDPGNAELFLIEFGYLPAEAAKDPAAFERAVAAAQGYYGLPETGHWDAATNRKILGAPRCGCSDVQRASAAAGFWGIKDLTYAIQRRPDAPGLSPAAFDDAVARAFSAWSACCGVVFTRTDSPQANLLLSIGRGSRAGFDGPSGTLAYAYLPPQPGFAGQLQMLYDNDEPWAVDGNPAGIDVETVSCHEFGHFLGFDHDPTPGQLMYAIYDPRINSPQSNDRARAASVYGGPRNRPVPPVVPVQPPSGKHSVEIMLRLDGVVSGPHVLDLNKRPS